MKPTTKASAHGPRILVLTAALAAALALPTFAQDDPAPPPAASPAGTARLVFEGRQVGSQPYMLTRQGPLFSLPVIAAILGVELTVGPLGDSHRLHFESEEVLVGPERAVAIVSSADGKEERLAFSQPPVKGLAGLMVPLDFLEKTLGDELGFAFTWRPETQELQLDRREVRTLRVSVDVIHQHSSTVEIRFSALPRWRLEKSDGAFEVLLAGDRLELPIDTSRARSPLVRGVTVRPDALRVELAPGAGVAEPRLLEDGEPRLVIEVFPQSAPRETPADEPEVAVKEVPGIRTIVIDPGHGGTETGAIGPHGTAEKDLTLTVSRSLKRLLERRLPVRVVLTRNDDRDLALENRTAIANQNKADLFVSIHFNSSYGRQAHGAETFFLSREASDQLAAQVAASENLEASGGEPDPEAELQLILWDLAQTYHLAESQRFANLVQEELNLTLGLRNRGVKQAPFLVLMGAMMPAVLVELGFLSNPDEEIKLASPIYQADLVDSLFRAIQRFKTQIEAQERPAGNTADLSQERRP